jgi:hypothetical protein
MVRRPERYVNSVGPRLCQAPPPGSLLVSPSCLTGNSNPRVTRQEPMRVPQATCARMHPSTKCAWHRSCHLRVPYRLAALAEVEAATLLKPAHGRGGRGQILGMDLSRPRSVLLIGGHRRADAGDAQDLRFRNRRQDCWDGRPCPPAEMTARQLWPDRQRLRSTRMFNPGGQTASEPRP